MSTTRRQFLTLLAAAAAGALPAARALAADAPLPHLAEDDPAAKALNYVADAKKAKDPVYKKGSTCAGCALYQAAAEKDGYAPCLAFQGKSVSKKGWCKAFAPKPA